MPHRRFDWHERIKAVEREYLAARRAVDRLSADVARDTGVLGEGPSPRDLKSAEENLEGTYRGCDDLRSTAVLRDLPRPPADHVGQLKATFARRCGGGRGFPGSLDLSMHLRGIPAVRLAGRLAVSRIPGSRNARMKDEGRRKTGQQIRNSKSEIRNRNPKSETRNPNS